MAQRHPHDDTVTLPPPHADQSSDFFVPLDRREAFAGVEADTVLIDDFKRQLHVEIPEPFWRTVNGRPVILNHRSNDADFAVALHWLKLDEAARRVARDAERRTTQELSDRRHTCPTCRRVDATARSDSLTGNTLCQRCRDEWRRQDAADHAALVVNGKTVCDLIAAARKKAATP